MPANIHFYIGRAGRGKTRALYGALKTAVEAGRRAVLFVPEQYTYEAERALAGALGGLIGVQVLSISRLGERIASNHERPFLNAQGRRMVIRREAYRLQSRLKVFGGVAARAGFAERMDALFAETKQAMLTPGALRDTAQAMAESPLREKLLDLALLYEAVQAYLDENYIDSEDAQNALLQALPHSFLCGADIFFDGFDHVNEQLYAVLGVLLRIAREMTFAFCVDPDAHGRDAALFAPEMAIYDRLREVAAGLGCRQLAPHVCTGGEERKHPALRRLDTELYAYPYRIYEGDIEAIRIVGAPVRPAEVEALAEAVLSAARSGVRYRDMAVIASDMAAYAPMVQRTFSACGIPLFLDARRSMQGHPLVELILAALSAAGSSLYRTELIRIGKTGLANVSDGDMEAFENYTLQRGLIGGRHFTEPFPPEEEAAERARAALVPPILLLNENLRAATAGEKAKAVYAYLEANAVQKQLHDETERLRAEGRFALMEEHAQVWGILMEMLEQLYAILGKEKMGRAEFMEVLSEGMKAYQVGVIPATADQVLLGDINRTRSREVRALFMLGCNEGLLPAPRAEQELLDDAEIQELQNLGMNAFTTAKTYADSDQFALYRAVTKAKDILWLGFSYADNNRELVPAMLLERIKTLFPGVTVEMPALRAENEAGGFSWLIRHLREASVEAEAHKRYFEARPDYRERLKHAADFAAAPHTPHTLGEPLAKKIYGENYRGSVSRLQVFRSCPYRHFLAYGMQLRPRREGREKRADIGNFAHMALDRFVAAVPEAGYTFKDIIREQAMALLDIILPQCLQEYEHGLLLSSPRAQALSEYHMRAVRDTAWALCTSFRAGDFTPYATEVLFGPEGALGALTLDDAGNDRITGVIDRVDVATGADGKPLVRVVDYKTGNKKLDYTDIYDGQDIQLPIYLGVVVGQGGGTPSGMFYQPVKTPVVDEGKEDAAERELYLKGVLLKEEETIEATEAGLHGPSRVVTGLRRNTSGKEPGLSASSPVLDKEEMAALLRYAKERAAQSARELLAGEIEARPAKAGGKSACLYCEYRSVCRYDVRTPSCRVRRVRKMDKGSFFKELGIDPDRGG